MRPPLLSLPLLLLLAVAAPARAALDISDADAEKIGRLIWRNEGQGQAENLTHWNAGEDFASLGIGHFIWYPKGRTGPFQESFPPMAEFLKDRGAPLPAWVYAQPWCPWPSRAAFLADQDSPRLAELRRELSATFALQARFIADRSEAALPKILAGLAPAEQAALRARYDAVAASPNGVYALVDYVNFKGEGLSPPERYDGLGWGLLQVLQEMGDVWPGQPAARAFSDAAGRVLRRRVEHSPAARGEARWLPGWLSRVATYAQPLP